MNIDPIYMIWIAISMIISIGLHEGAHARTSDRLGDPTPARQGRLTLNPLNHIDPIGFVLIFLIGFGRGRAVQVQPAYYRNPKYGEMLVAFAGPLMNICLAILGIFVFFAYISWGDSNISWYTYQSDYITYFLHIFVSLNISLAVFNMIPLPPLDGFRIMNIISYRTAIYIQNLISRFPIVFVIIFGLFASRKLGGFISIVSGSITTVLYQIIGNIFFL